MDRRSLSRKLKELKPDDSEDKGGKQYNRYFMSNVVAHLMGGEALDYGAERTRLTKEQADKTEMENQVKRGELIERRQVLNDVGSVVHVVKTRFLAMPSQVSAFLAHKDAIDIESQLSDAIHDTLSELAGGTSSVLEAPQEDESQRVG